jgi:hypothetical protein
MRNPVGRGFHKHLKTSYVDGSPLPNTEEIARPIAAPDSTAYLPMSLGPLGRHWEPRAPLAGTYDEAWLKDHFPFLPPDFDERYYQAAPPDQQIPHPQGGEEIVLVNLTPGGRVAFTLPVFDAPIHFFLKAGGREDGRLVLDTIVLEPDEGRFTLTWRATRVLKKKMLEVDQTMVGRRSASWWAQREGIEYPIRLVPVTSEPRTTTD